MEDSDNADTPSKLEAYRRACSKATLQEKKEGFFLSLVENLKSDLDFTYFSKLTTDLERVKYVVQKCWSGIGSQLIYRGKREEDAIEKRIQGNKFFEKGEHAKALLAYSQSVIQSPVGPELVKAYTNRSALLQKMGEHSLSISDAELAISYSSPEETRHKLYERMAHSYIQLSNFHKAKVLHRLASHFFEKHDKENSKFKEKLEKLKKQIEAGEKSGKKPEKGSPCEEETPLSPRPSGNKKFPSASGKFDVTYAKGQGRYAYAKKKISPGEVIIMEKPFASVLSLDRMGTHCSNCLKRLKAPISCDTCAGVVYCSRDCKKDGDTSYHKHECRIMNMLIGSGMSSNSFLALRMVTLREFEEWKKILPSLLEGSISPEEIPLSDGEQGELDPSYRAIYQLGGLEEERPPEDFLERTIMAVFIMKCLRQTGYFEVNLFKYPFPSIEEVQVGALILRNLQVLQFNAYEVCEFLMGKDEKDMFKKSSTFSVGLAIYPTASYFNHSCSPDVTRHFIGTTLVATAVKSIPASCPITDNYGPNFRNCGRDDRRFKLAGRYWFYCTCEACLEDYPLLSKFPENLSPSTPEEKNALLLLEKLEALFDKGIRSMEKRGKVSEAVKAFINYISAAEDVLQPFKGSSCSFYPYKTVLLAAQALALCYCSLGSVFLRE